MAKKDTSPRFEKQKDGSLAIIDPTTNAVVAEVESESKREKKAAVASGGGALTRFAQRQQARKKVVPIEVKIEGGESWFIAKPSMTALLGAQSIAQGIRVNMESREVEPADYGKALAAQCFAFVVAGPDDTSPMFSSFDEALQFVDDSNFTEDALMIVAAIQEHFSDFLGTMM